MTNPPTILSLDSQQITPKRLQWIMDVGHCTIADWNEKKLIPHFREERIIRYAPENVLRFIVSHTVRSKARQPGLAPFVNPAAPVVLTEDAWTRIERLIKDQIEAQKGRAA